MPAQSAHLVHIGAREKLSYEGFVALGEKYSVTKMTSSHCGGELFTAMKNPVGRTVRQDSTSICIKDLKIRHQPSHGHGPYLHAFCAAAFLALGWGMGVCAFSNFIFGATIDAMNGNVLCGHFRAYTLRYTLGEVIKVAHVYRFILPRVAHSFP